MRVEPLDVDVAHLRRLVSDWTFKPYRWADVPEDSVNALALFQLRQNVGRDGVWTGVTRATDGGIRGLTTLQPLPWDSRMLGVAAARVEFVAVGDYSVRRPAYEALLDAVVNEARANKVEHLSARIDAGDDAAIHALESAGFLSVDALLSFERAVAVHEPRSVASDFTVRDARDEDSGAIESIAAASFVDGRFHADPSISPAVATSVYREWAASCCHRRAADDVIVAVTATGEVVGFVACRLHGDTGAYLGRLTASIVLIAATPATRRRGVGRQLVTASLESVARRSAVVMQVGTQIRNTAAARLYEECGFRLAAASQSFRAVISR